MVKVLYLSYEHKLIGAHCMWKGSFYQKNLHTATEASSPTSTPPPLPSELHKSKRVDAACVRLFLPGRQAMWPMLLGYMDQVATGTRRESLTLTVIDSIVSSIPKPIVIVIITHFVVSSHIVYLHECRIHVSRATTFTRGPHLGSELSVHRHQ